MVVYAPIRTHLMSAGPLDEVAQLRQCEALLELGRAAEALARIAVLAARDPSNPYIHTLMAQALLAVGAPERGAEAARRAISLAPHNEWPHRLASIALARLGKRDLALAEARSAVRLAPHNWMCLVWLAAVAVDRRSTRGEAESAASAALRLAPGEAEVQRIAGTVAMAAGRRDEAQVHFHRALSIDPQSSATLNELGRLALGGRGPRGGTKLANAANTFADAVRTDPRATASRHNLDVVIRAFFAMLSYLLFLDTYVLTHALGRGSSAATRTIPVLLLAIPTVVATRFFSRATPVIRRLLIDECTSRPLLVPVAFGIVGALGVIACAVAPASARGACVLIAGSAALISRFSLAMRVNQSVQTAKTGTSQPMFSTGTLWCLAIVLGGVTLLLLGAAVGGGQGATRVAVASAFPGVATVLVFRSISQRLRRRRR